MDGVAEVDRASSPAGTVREVWWRQLLALLGLTGFAISQPMLSVLGESPTVFAFYGVDGWAMVGFVVVLAMLPPLVLWGVGLACTAVSPRAGRAVHLAMVAALAGLCGIQVVKAAGLEREALVAALGGAIGIGVAWAYGRSTVVAMWVRMTAFLPAVALASFLLASSASDLVGGPESVGAAPSGADDLPPVVMIVLDELPTRSILDGDDQVDAVRFPHLARFAEDATWFRHYTSVAPATRYAVPAILTGSQPIDADPLWTSYPDNLFTLLAPTHDLVAFETATELCHLEQCEEGSSGRARLGALASLTADVYRERVSPSPNRGARLDTFEEELESAGDALAPVAAGSSPASTPSGVAEERVARQARRVERVDQFIETFDDGGARPSLHYLHLMMPHQPWRFDEAGRPYETLSQAARVYPFSTQNDQGAWVTALTEQRHLLQAQYTDSIVGDVMAALDERGLYDDSLVIVLGDHGIAFEEGRPARTLDDEARNVASLAYSPLFVKPPGQASGSVDDTNLLSIDVLPTIADLLSIDVPFAVEGAPAGSPTVADRSDEKPFFRVSGLFWSTLGDAVEFTDELPSAEDRWIPPITGQADARSGLYEAFALDNLIGEELDAMLTAEGGTARIPHLDHLVAPDDNETPVALYLGQVLEPLSTEGTVVAAIDGEIVAASPLYEAGGEPGRFALLFPPAVVGAGDVRMAVMVGTQVTELTLTD